MESRPYWVLRPDAECEEPRCAEGPRRPWSAWVDADNALGALVGPWQYQCTGWVGSGVVPHPVYPPYRTPPDTTLYRHPVDHRGPGHLGTCTYDRFGMLEGDPRGRIRTCYPGGRLQAAARSIPPPLDTVQRLLIDLQPGLYSSLASIIQPGLNNTAWLQ